MKLVKFRLCILYLAKIRYFEARLYKITLYKFKLSEILPKCKVS